MRRVTEAQGKTLWERTVEWTIAIGERVLAPIERFIGRRSLVGDATFFPLERFSWVRHIEDNWTVIRQELETVLEDHAGLVQPERLENSGAAVRPHPQHRWQPARRRQRLQRRQRPCLHADHRCPEPRRLWRSPRQRDYGRQRRHPGDRR